MAADYTADLLKQYSGLTGMLELAKNITNDSWLNSNLAILTNGIKDAALKDDATDVTLHFEQKKDRLLFTFTESAENAVSGGALTEIKKIISNSVFN